MHDHCASSASVPGGPPKAVTHHTPEDRLVVHRVEESRIVDIVLDKLIIIINAERPSSVDLALCTDGPPRPQHPAAVSLAPYPIASLSVRSQATVRVVVLVDLRAWLPLPTLFLTHLINTYFAVS